MTAVTVRSRFAVLRLSIPAQGQPAGGRLWRPSSAGKQRPVTTIGTDAFREVRASPASLTFEHCLTAL